ncbi:Methyltransferase type 11 [Beutenbergia cavernae DSM 12333]|uniref:Methyltransferase type 11 n=1 Tax=Beutenbergia cavernae (strain ATCC BAA-8 / DSM 12333 / CCUG 43141 / JCM 11478 / NBRC 16432 / NCIMB 13614 / HKI 0122) TaxID=471853 RepID=C5BXK8_BEUC1|nr:methyltransferase domain-containing protein [Beutenbergia cavernae]ACQ80891.1 Methyltransferase type 11 [Beutenbergia cavernae DSM 12333]
MTPATAELVRPDRYPRSAGYDPAWVLGLDMGPHPLWQLEDLLADVELQPGARVLDLGCGKGATSVFLARELDVEVVAFDLWVEADELHATLEEAGVADRVSAVNGDARDLPFADDEFDAVVSIDAFEYLGTDVRFLPGLLRVVRPGGAVGMTTPALRTDPYESDPPGYVTDVVGWETAGWHAPQWWARHWELTGLVDGVVARLQDGGRDDWVRWCRALGDGPDAPVRRMLEADTAEELGFAVVSARKR